MFLKKDRHVGRSSPSHWELCYLHANTFFALACATGDTRVTLVRDFGKSCAWKGDREVERQDYRHCPVLLKVPLATARHAGGKRAQLMNSAMIVAFEG